MKRGSIFELDGVPRLREAAPLALAACCGNDRWLRDPCHYCCRRCGKRWIKPEGIRLF